MVPIICLSITIFWRRKDISRCLDPISTFIKADRNAAAVSFLVGKYWPRLALCVH